MAPSQGPTNLRIGGYEAGQWKPMLFLAAATQYATLIPVLHADRNRNSSQFCWQSPATSLTFERYTPWQCNTHSLWPNWMHSCRLSKATWKPQSLNAIRLSFAKLVLRSLERLSQPMSNAALQKHALKLLSKPTKL